MSNSKISGCIVTHNNAGCVCDTVSSLLKHTSADFTLYCVDNLSQDGTPDIIKSTFADKGVEVIINTENTGFGAAHSQIIPRLESDYHCIINPDITIRDDVISRMADYMDGHPEVAMLSPCIRFPDGQLQVLGKRDPKLKYLFASRLRTGMTDRLLREYAMLDFDLTNEFEIENASGCFMFIRTSVFRELGGFDPRYFLYFEDCDLSREVRKKGKIMYFPNAAVYHAWERGGAKNVKLLKIQIKSMTEYFKKWGIR